MILLRFLSALTVITVFVMLYVIITASTPEVVIAAAVVASVAGYVYIRLLRW